MIVINFKNIEELVFFNDDIRKSLYAKYQKFYDTWTISKRVPHLKAIGLKAILDLLSSLDQEDITFLSEHFKQDVKVEKLSYHLVQNVSMDISSEIELFLDEKLDWKGEIAIHRNAKMLHLTSWR